MQSTFAFSDRAEGNCVCVFMFAHTSECGRVHTDYCTYVLFLFLLFTFSREEASLSLQCVLICLMDLFLRRLLLNIIHLDAQCLPLPLIPCLLRPYYHANDFQHITEHFHLDELLSEGLYSTCRIKDEFICCSVPLMLQELKGQAAGRQMKDGKVSINQVPNTPC